MLTSSLFLMRRSVGVTIPVPQMTLVGHSEWIDPANVTLKSRQGPDDPAFTGEELYAEFLPETVSLPGAGLERAPQSASLRFPSDIPRPTAGFRSIFAWGPAVEGSGLSRELWIELELTLDASKVGNPPVGGLCFSGFPYLPYYVTAQGENSANFGLPREVRVSWSSGAGAGFIDDETAETRQQVTSHSGAQFFSLGPLVTDRLRVRLSDFPKILLSNDPIRERWGIIIPYLFVYAHAEGTRYSPSVPAGLIAATHSNPSVNPSFFQKDIQDGSADALSKAPADWVTETAGKYVCLSAASALRSESDRRAFDVDEFFVSQMTRGDRLWLTIEQAEEHRRCLAGLRLRFAGSGFLRRFDVDIYEIDPPDGVSPLGLSTSGDTSKYVVHLARHSVTPDDDAEAVIRFQRPTTSRYLAIEITARDEGRIGIVSINAVQSAHVSLAPRAARSQHVHALRFRMIGPDLFDDYSKLSRNGFSLTVEHVVANRRRRTLFSADSLLALLESGAARSFANHRRHTREHEISRSATSSASEQATATRTDGWNRTETGAGVGDLGDGGDGLLFGAGGALLEGDRRLTRDDMAAGGEHGFVSLGNQENHVHHQELGAVHPAEQNYKAFVGGVFLDDPDLPGELAPKVDRLWKTTPTFKAEAWRSDHPDPLSSQLNVRGTWNTNIPPLWVNEINYVQTLADLVGDLELGQATGAAFTHSLANAVQVKNLLAVNGFGASLSLGIVGMSVNAGVPSIAKSDAVGTRGSISRQANQTSYSYSQNRVARFDQGRTIAEAASTAESERTTTRVPVDPVANRSSGVEVLWQGRACDILTGAIPLDIAFPALAEQAYRISDQFVRVRLEGYRKTGAGPGPDLHLDVWFELSEEAVRDDY